MRFKGQFRILNSKNFAVLKNQERVTLVRLKVHDLGFENGATTKEIYKRAEELGLELCSAEVGPHYRLKYTDQPLGEWFSVAMKQIADRHGRPRVFTLECRRDGLWLYCRWAKPADWCTPGHEFLFRLRKFGS